MYCNAREVQLSRAVFPHKGQPGQQGGTPGAGRARGARSVTQPRPPQAPEEPRSPLWGQVCVRSQGRDSWQGQPHGALRDHSISKQTRPFRCDHQQPHSGLRAAGALRGTSPPAPRRRAHRHLSTARTPCPPSPEAAAAPRAGARVPPPPLRARCPVPRVPPVPVPTTTTSNSAGRLSAILGRAVTRAPPAERAGAAEGVPAAPPRETGP